MTITALKKLHIFIKKRKNKNKQKNVLKEQEDIVLKKIYNPYEEIETLYSAINYIEFYENFKIEDNYILYESYHGRTMSCSPFAIFKFLLEDKRFNNYLHIWVINDEKNIDKKYKNFNNVIFIEKNSEHYIKYLASAKYLINNTTFPDWYIRKENQIYLNTWYGTPIKTVGKDIKKSFMEHKTQTRDFLQTSHIVVPNHYTAKILEKSYDIKDIYNGVLKTTGSPKQDLMLNISDKEKDEIYKILNIDKSKKIVLYAPSSRDTVYSTTLNYKQLKNDIQHLSTLEDVEILFKGDYIAEELLKELNVNITIPSNNIDTNSLLSIVDILITDYSSICFDFMAMNKPIIYYIYDKDKYLQDLYFEVETIGDYICYSIDELKESIEKILKEKYIPILQNIAKNDFCTYDDGFATKRVVDLIFFSKREEIEPPKKREKESILLYGGSLVRSETTNSFIELCNFIDKSKYSVTITFDINDTIFENRRIEQFDKEIKVIPRFGIMLMTHKEQELISKFNSNTSLNSNDETWDSFEHIHKREFKRIFGYSKFDYIINFEGYAPFWVSLMGIKLNSIKSNIIYKHDNPNIEHKMKHSYLNKVYSFYDKAIYYNKTQNIHNILEKLKKYFKIKSYNKNEVVLYKIEQLNSKNLYLEIVGNDIEENSELLFKSRKVPLKEETLTLTIKPSSLKKEESFYFLGFIVPLKVLEFETETVVHTWDISLFSKKEYRIKSFDKLQTIFQSNYHDFIPYSTIYQNFSLISIRKKSKEDVIKYKKSITFVLARIDLKGGVTKTTIDLANILAENGYKITLISLDMINTPNNFPISKKINFNYVSLALNGKKSLIMSNIYSKKEIINSSSNKKLKKFFATLNTDFVYLPIYGASMFINLLKSMPSPIKKIIGDHSGRRYKIYYRLLRENKKISFQEFRNLTTDYHYLDNLEKINAIHVVNPLAKPIYEQITSKPILGIPNIVNVEELVIKDSIEADWSKRKKVIVAVGSLTKIKNFHTLIKAFHKIHIEFQDWILEIYGEGQEKENLQNLIKGLSLNNKVYLKGFSNNIIEKFKSSMLHVSVSSIESFGLTIVEAMSQRTLVMSTYTTIGAKYLLENNISGFLAKSNQEEDISVKLKEVLTLIGNNNKLIFKIQENAYLKSKQFNASSISKEWDKALLNLN